MDKEGESIYSISEELWIENDWFGSRWSRILFEHKIWDVTADDTCIGETESAWEEKEIWYGLVPTVLFQIRHRMQH
jgi:hypothetical protein